MGMSTEEYNRQRQAGRFRVLSDEDTPESLKDSCPCAKHGDGSSGSWCYRDELRWHVVEFEGDTPLRIVGSDGGEPEDQLLVRDWRWVAVALNNAYEAGIRSALIPAPAPAGEQDGQGAEEAAPIGNCPKCGAPWFAHNGFCGGCRP